MEGRQGTHGAGLERVEGRRDERQHMVARRGGERHVTQPGAGRCIPHSRRPLQFGLEASGMQPALCLLAAWPLSAPCLASA